MVKVHHTTQMQSCRCNDYERMRQRASNSLPPQTTCDACGDPYAFKYPRLRRALGYAGGALVFASYAAVPWVAVHVGWRFVLGGVAACGATATVSELVARPTRDPKVIFGRFLTSAIAIPLMAPSIPPFALYTSIARRIP